MEYELDIDPYPGMPFEEFSKEQAKEYFEWYMSRIGHRIQVLEQYVRWEGFEIAFDYSPDSLVPLWECFFAVHGAQTLLDYKGRILIDMSIVFLSKKISPRYGGREKRRNQKRAGIRVLRVSETTRLYIWR